MTLPHPTTEELSLFTSRSSVTTETNKTGAWRFMRPRYTEKTAPCGAACPAGEDIARIQMLTAAGKIQEAAGTILRENPFPAVCGRVCYHPCQRSCNRSDFDETVSIRQVERLLGDAVMAKRPTLSPLRPPAGRRIAVVGAGPAGLSAAYFLALLGYECDLFEAAAQAGGLLRWGIPRYRLPAQVLNAEIGRIVDLGVKIYCGQRVTEAFLADAAETYDALFMGCGLGRPIPLKIPGGELARDGLSFLREIQGGEACVRARKVAVIGGGNTAVDLARSLKRLGADPVIVYRRRREEMPAFGREAEMALEENVDLMELMAPVRIEESESGYRLTLQPMKTAETGADGRARVVPDGDTRQTLEVEAVYTAIGASPAAEWLVPSMKKPAAVRFTHCTLTQRRLPILFGGDLTNDFQSVADAVASGKAGAMALDTLFREGPERVADRLAGCRVGSGASLSMEIYLEGSRKTRAAHEVAFDGINTAYFAHSKRKRPPVLPPAERVRSFDEVETGLSQGEAAEEAVRCFNCGLCNDCDNCRLYCPEVAVTRSENREESDSRRILYDYCKGCGICVVECPRSAMDLTIEEGL
jgi:NADPH-dependent glutamate synthase beta subunit-like oxidoreductase